MWTSCQISCYIIPCDIDLPCTLQDVNHLWLLFFPPNDNYMLLFSHYIVCDSLQTQVLEHNKLLCPSVSPRVCSNSCPLSQGCCLTTSPSVTPFFFCLQSFLASGSFPMSQLFAAGGQRTGTSASASVLPKNIEGWFPLGLTGLILQSKGL